mmetsp:Transcript_62224/g.192917  ORF Transcript_62224/g.192917 Transcript_62224/m.192917 type:complete len:224 (+) Transcript_62224:1150-1821(+)
MATAKWQQGFDRGQTAGQVVGHRPPPGRRRHGGEVQHAACRRRRHRLRPQCVAHGEERRSAASSGRSPGAEPAARLGGGACAWRRARAVDQRDEGVAPVVLQDDAQAPIHVHGLAYGHRPRQRNAQQAARRRENLPGGALLLGGSAGGGHRPSAALLLKQPEDLEGCLARRWGGLRSGPPPHPARLCPGGEPPGDVALRSEGPGARGGGGQDLHPPRLPPQTE